jgi:selenocysteine lyase/cysteine desulfurase
MIEQQQGLIESIRDKFAHVEMCPFEGERIFFENAGGSLRLKSVVETSALFASYPDNQGRDNDASRALMNVIENSKKKMRLFFNATDGNVFVGESGTELLFRLIRTAALGTQAKGKMISTSLEHPASMSAMQKWSNVTNRAHIVVEHNSQTGTVDLEKYDKKISNDLRVASIVHTSPVTGMSLEVSSVVNKIRRQSPECIIIVDGIQHSSHGGIDIDSYDIDGYVVSPYKMFSRHGYGVAWVSDRLAGMKKEQLFSGPSGNWELGTRDTGSYATFSDVVDYLEWLGSNFTKSKSAKEKIKMASKAIISHEKQILSLVINGTDGISGLKSISRIKLIGENTLQEREGVISFAVEGMPSYSMVESLRKKNIRVHIRKNDHYCGNILNPLQLEDCIRFSICHYNTKKEALQFLKEVNKICAS